MQLFTNYIFLPIEVVLRGIFELLYSISGSYGISLVLLSVIVSTLLLPLYKIADTWRNKEKAHQKLMKADLDAIKAHYKGQERYYSTVAAYRVYKYNPFMSLRVSVGFLIQIPFFFAAYHLLSHYPSFDGVSFGVVANLALPDALFYGVNILPIIMTIINIVAGLVFLTELNRNDTLQLLGLSVFFLVILYSAPSALVLYWTMNNIYSLAKYSITNKPNIKDLFVKVTHLCKQSILHPYISNAIKILLLTAIYLVAIYATHKWRSATSASNAIEAAILILFPCLLAMLAKIFTYRKVNSTKLSLGYILSGAPLLLACTFGIMLLKINYLSSDSLPFFNFTLTSNRLRQLTIFFQLIAFALLYVGFHKISLPIYKIHKAPQKVLIRFYVATVLSCLITIIIASPIVSYLSSPKDFGGSIYKVITFSTLFAFLLFVLAYIIGTALKQVRYRLYYRLLIFFVWLSIVYIAYGFIIQLNLGALQALSFSAEQQILQFTSKLFILEPLAIISLYFVLLRFFAKIRYRLTMCICFTTLFLFSSTIWNLYKNSALFSLQSTIQNTASTVGKTPEELLPDYHNKLMAFSKEKNILYIVLDAFPADLMEQLLQKKPELYAKYEGFTWYKNTVSISGFTFTSTVAMLGGHKYDPVAIEKLQQPVRKSILDVWSYWPKHLPQYNVNYINPPYLDLNDKFSISTINNNFPNSFSINTNEEYFPYWKALYPQADATQVESSNAFNIVKLINFATFKISPLHLKQRLYTDETWPLFITGSINNRVYDTIKFHRDFKAHHVVLDSFSTSSNVSSPNPTLKVYWGSVHYPFYIRESCDGVSTEEIIDKSFDIWGAENALTHMHCSLESIAKWIAWMKQENIYHNTKIIIASDHGESHVFTRNDTNNYHEDGGIYALLMVKDFNAQKPLQISEQLMSNADIPSIISSAEPSIVFPNILPDPIKSKRTNAPMIFYKTPHHSNKAVNKMEIDYSITVTGNVYDEEQWVYSNGDTQK